MCRSNELVSKRIKLDEVNAAFEAMEKGEVARSVIVYQWTVIARSLLT